MSLKQWIGELWNRKANKVTSATAGHLASLDATGDLTDSGIAPYPFLPSITSRKRRILCLGDSMFGGLLPAEVTAAITNSEAMVLGHGGEYPASGAVALASDIKYRGRAGNLLADSRITNWDKDRATVTESTFPSTGGACYAWNGDHSYTNSQIWVDVYPPDDGITEGLTFSFLVEPSALVRGWYGGVYKNGWSTLLGYTSIPSLDTYFPFMPLRFYAYIPPGSYASGDYLRFQFSHTDNTGGGDYILYMGEAQLQLGSVVLPYRETTGTADTPAALDYHGSPDALNRKLWDLVAFCYRNPAGWRNTTATEDAYTYLADTASTVVPRVLLIEPTPLRDTGTDTWKTGADDAADVPNDLFGAVKRAALKRNCFRSSVRDDFIASGLTPSTLVGDTIHPTDAGDARIAALIGDVADSTDDKVPTKITGGACVRMGGIESGTWADYSYAISNHRFDMLSVGISLTLGGISGAVRSTTSGSVTYKVSGRQLSLIYLLSNPGGTATVVVDNLPALTVTLQNGTYNYMRTIPLCDDNGPITYPDGEHTVTVTRASGTVRLFGIVGLGPNLELDVDRASKVSAATSGNFASLTADGDLADSGKSPSSAFTPTSHASSHNAGGGDALAIDAAAATGSLRTLGTAATSACAGNDSRLSDARTPTAHAASHADGGSDEVTPLAIGAQVLHGFVDRTATLSFNDGTRKVSITPSTSYDFWVNGTKYTKSVAQEVTIDNTAGLHFCYEDSSGVLQKSMDAWDIESVSAIPATIIWWNSAAGRQWEERHGFRRSSLTWHKNQHTTMGARYESGLGLTLPTTGTPGDFQLETGYIWDEDLRHTIAQQTQCLICYRNSGGAAMTFDGTLANVPYKMNGANMRYDSAGVLTDAGANHYVTTWVYLTNDLGNSAYVVLGQASHTTLAAARAEGRPTIPMSTAEWVLAYKLIWRNTGATPTFVEATDFRNSQSGPPVNYTAPASVAAQNVLVDSTSFTGILSSKTTAQTAFDALDDHSAAHQSGGADAIKLDDLAATDDNTDLNASTTAHGLLLKATAPASGLLNVVGIANGESVYANKAIFDTTNPAALGTAGPGSQLVAARRDHVHTMPTASDLGLGTSDGPTFDHLHFAATTKGVVGTTAADDAASGYVGEYVSSSRTTGYNWGASSDTWANIAADGGGNLALSLTAGDWDVTMSVAASLNGATATYFSIAASKNSGTTTTDHIYGDNVHQAEIASTASGEYRSLYVSNWRVNVSGATTVYGKGQFGYTGGTPKIQGARISARRVR